MPTLGTRRERPAFLLARRPVFFALRRILKFRLAPPILTESLVSTGVGRPWFLPRLGRPPFLIHRRRDRGWGPEADLAGLAVPYWVGRFC